MIGNEFTGYLKRRQHSTSSIKTSEKTVTIFLKWLERENMEAGQVSYQDILGFMKYCSKKGASQRTVQHYMNAVRHYFAHLEEEGIVACSPAMGINVKGVKRKTLYHILEPHELHALYNRYPDDSLKGRRDKVMLGLLVYQGLKSEELGRLETSHVKLREGQVDVPGARKSNGRLLRLEAHQVMDMYDYVLQARPQLLSMRPKRSYQKPVNTEKLFIGEGGHSEHFGNYITRLMVKTRMLNPQVKNARQVRASVITKWVKTCNLREAQYLAGHRYISTTEGYLQNDMEGLKEEVQQFHPLG